MALAWRRTDRFRIILVIGLVIAAAAAIYWPVRNFGFLNYDDPVYVTDNPYVRAGVTRTGVAWALVSMSGNWHPLTWLSHMIDVEVCGMNPGCHHRSNVLLHALNTVLLLVVLWKMTGAWWRSVVVAGLFLAHPLHVESVAWVSERKDVLSTAFWFSTLAAYHRYVMSPGTWRYLLVVLFFVLGLAAKPMLVTLPAVLLLIDYWPLGRWGGKAGSGRCPRSVWRQLVLEKLPLIVLAVASSVVTLVAQHKAMAVKSFDSYGLSTRAANALVSYVAYLSRTIWPRRLSVVYPHPGDGIPLWQALVAGTVLGIATGAVVRLARRHPYLSVGWFWYLGTLVPVIGLVQVGWQGMADRYTYIPLTGIFVMAAWGIADSTARWGHRAATVSMAAIVLLSLSIVAARTQVEHWRTSRSLFEAALRNTSRNFVAENNLGNALEQEGKTEEAIPHFMRSIETNNHYSIARNNLGVSLLKQGKIAEAAERFQAVLELDAGNADAHYNLGFVEASKGEYGRAVDHYRQALATNPQLFRAYNNLATVLSQEGKPEEAITQYRQALRIAPFFAEAHFNLANALETVGNQGEAIKHYEETIRLEPGNVNALNNLGLMLARAGGSGQAESLFRRALAVDPEFAPARRNLARLLAGRP